MKRLHIQIKGVVQGVGFRPFVHSLANRYGLAGWVINDSRGVEIEVDGDAEALIEFLKNLTDEAPPLAQIVRVENEFSEVGEEQGFSGFEIKRSEVAEGERVLISPDVAVCRDCLGEMYDPTDRRYRYPFLNCTNCGPRFTIIEDLPYDRDNTTMREFPMCDTCRAEYENPEDRRFHAQPTCCPVSGPRLWFADADGTELDFDPLELAVNELLKGKTIAVKGIGGFHLACDATNAAALKRLRERKHREAKPLAVMVGGISSARMLAEITDDAARALLSPARPIVICPQRADSPIADADIWGVTGGIGTIGIMLPYAPLHHLLFRPLPIESDHHPEKIILPEEIGGPGGPDADLFIALVMTSGNLSDEPIAVENTEAITRLKGIADGFLLNDRGIHRRADDSVAAIRDGIPTIWRWGRGYVPRPIFLPEPLPPVLAVGAELKNTICNVRGDKAFVSPHIGDLKTFEAYEYLRETIEHQGKILDVRPEYVACDLHPDYQSTRWAEEESGLSIMRIQHHHAHCVALMAEHDALDEEIIGLAMDGTGLGTDNAIWGGDVLIAGRTEFRRVAHFNYAPLPGGDLATKEVWRSALGRLWTEESEDGKGGGGGGEFRKLFDDVMPDKVAMVGSMIQSDVNCPPVCSLGRLFDAAGFIAGIGSVAAYDGQIPMLLEAACEGVAEPSTDVFGGLAFDPGKYILPGNSEHILDGSGIIRDLSRLKFWGESLHVMARWFHHRIVVLLVRIADIVREETGIEIVGLTGGCFMNGILHEELSEKLRGKGFRVLTHRLTPANDGCISLGQAVIAGYRILKKNHGC